MIFYKRGLYRFRHKARSDAAIIVWDSPNTKAYHNTILTNGNFRLSVEFRFETNNSEAKNNSLNVYIASRDRGKFNRKGNDFSAVPSIFVIP